MAKQYKSPIVEELQFVSEDSILMESMTIDPSDPPMAEGTGDAPARGARSITPAEISYDVVQ